jgi:hypothetical protein
LTPSINKFPVFFMYLAWVSGVKFLFMWFAVFLPLSLFAFGAFGAADISKISFIREYAQDFNNQLNRLMIGKLPATIIGNDLNFIFRLNRSEYFQLILNSFHELTVPIAMVSLITNGDSANEIKFMVHHHLNPPSHDNKFNNLMVVLMNKMTKLIENTAFDYGLAIQDRVETIGHLSQCYDKLFQILVKSPSKSGPCEVEHRIRNENMELWLKVFILETPERDLLLQSDPRITISKCLLSLVKKINAEKNYRITPAEECIVRNLVIKILEMGPFEFLPFLASLRPRSLCLFLSFESKYVYRNFQFKQSLPKMAPKILKESSLIQKFNEFSNAKEISGYYAEITLKKLKRLAGNQ